MPPMLFLLLAWAGFALVLTGIGSLVLSRGGRAVSRVEAFWVGVAVVLVYGNLWHLVLPLDARFWIVPGLAAAAGWWKTWRPPPFTLVEVLVALFALWVAGHALMPVVHPDAGLYHVQVVRLYAAAPAVPGIGNLNPYACFNHAFFLLPAAFGVGPFVDRGWHLVNGLLVVAAMPWPLAALERLLLGRSQQVAIDVFTFLLAARLIDAPLMMHLSGPTADVAVLAGSAFLLARAAAAPRTAPWVSGLLFASLLSMKATSLGIVLAAAFAEWRWPERWQLRPTLGAMGVAALCLGPWLAHGVVLSGYLFYPVTALRLPVDWAVPGATAKELADWAWAFARWPGHPLAEVQAASWPLRWLVFESLNNRDFLLPVVTVLTSGLALAVAARGRRLSFNTLALGGAVLLGLVVWWFSLPDLRFAGVLPWALAGVTLGALTDLLRSRRYLIWLTCLALVLGGLLGPEVKLRWPTEVPSLPPSACTPSTLSTGEPVCLWQPFRDCFETNCARPPVNAGGRPGRAGYRPLP